MENECLFENHERNQNKKAIKELLFLLAYPVLFYILALFPLINRVYSAISYNASVGWAVAHALRKSLWGFFSNWALIIHILVMRWLKKKMCVQIKKHTNDMKDTGTVMYTPNTEFSINPKSKFNIPTESDIDNEYNS